MLTVSDGKNTVEIDTEDTVSIKDFLEYARMGALKMANVFLKEEVKCDYDSTLFKYYLKNWEIAHNTDSAIGLAIYELNKKEGDYERAKN